MLRLGGGIRYIELYSDFAQLSVQKPYSSSEMSELKNESFSTISVCFSSIQLIL